MAKNATIEALNGYVADRLAGVPAAKAQANHGVSHAQAEFHFLRTVPVAQGGMQELVGTVAANPAEATRLRSEGQSWGRIAVLMNVPEGKARKLFAEGSGLKSQGNRIGRGGRFYYGDNGQPLYDGDLKSTGTPIRVTEKQLEGALKAAEEAKNLIHDEEARKAAFKAAFGRLPKSSDGTIAQQVMAIRRHVKAEATRKRTAKKA